MSIGIRTQSFQSGDDVIDTSFQRARITTRGVASGSESRATIRTGALSTGDEVQDQGHESNRQIKRVPPATAHRIRLLFDQCLESLDRADSEPDVVLRDNAFDQFVDALDGLWGCRQSREENFGEAINMIQALMAKRHRKDFTEAQLVSIAECVELLRDEPYFGDLVLDDVTDKLVKGDLDVFRELN